MACPTSTCGLPTPNIVTCMSCEALTNQFWCVDTKKSPNQTWIPRITLSVSLKPPSSTISITWYPHFSNSGENKSYETFVFVKMSSLSLSLSLSPPLFIALQYACWLDLVVGATKFLYILTFDYLLVLVCMCLFVVYIVVYVFAVFPMCSCWRELSKPNIIVWGFFV